MEGTLAIFHKRTVDMADAVPRGPDVSIECKKVTRRARSVLKVSVLAPAPTSYDIDLVATALDGRYGRLTSLAERALGTGHDGDLFNLAHVGHEAFQEIFPDPNVRALFPAPQAGVDAAGGHRSQTPVRIDIICDSFGFPFGLLYLSDPDRVLDARHFLNAAHIVNRLPATKDFLKTRPARLSVGKPRLAYAKYSGLPHAVNREIPRIETLGQDGDDHCHVLRIGTFPMSVRNRGSDIRAALNRDQAQITHFSCHASVGTASNPAWLLIDDECKITTDFLGKKGFGLKACPVVFLNACEMAVDKADAFHAFVQLFFQMNARAVLAPECKVKDGPAADFSIAFYGFFVCDGHSIAEAAWSARRERMAAGDLTGLVYSVFGQPETAIHWEAEAA